MTLPGRPDIDESLLHQRMMTAYLGQINFKLFIIMSLLMILVVEGL